LNIRRGFLDIKLISFKNSILLRTYRVVAPHVLCCW